MKTFDQEKFNNTKQCEYCDYKFYKEYDDRIITLHERVDRNKLKYIIDNYTFKQKHQKHYNYIMIH